MMTFLRWSWTFLSGEKNIPYGDLDHEICFSHLIKLHRVAAFPQLLCWTLSVRFHLHCCVAFFQLSCFCTFVLHFFSQVVFALLYYTFSVRLCLHQCITLFQLGCTCTSILHFSVRFCLHWCITLYQLGCACTGLLHFFSKVVFALFYCTLSVRFSLDLNLFVRNFKRY